MPCAPAASPYEDDAITLTIAPDADCALSSLTLNGADVTAEVADNAYTFAMTVVDAGCGTVYVSAPAGGTTQARCEGQDSLIFAEE